MADLKETIKSILTDAIHDTLARERWKLLVVKSIRRHKDKIIKRQAREIRNLKRKLDAAAEALWTTQICLENYPQGERGRLELPSLLYNLLDGRPSGDEAGSVIGTLKEIGMFPYLDHRKPK